MKTLLENGIIANIVDWVQLNKMARATSIVYLGNRMEEESIKVYALFKIDENYYAKEID